MSYKRLDPQDITLNAEAIVAPLWSGDQVELNSVFTSSTQVASNTGNYYYEVYNLDPVANSETAKTQFSIAFGDKNGSGSLNFDTAVKGKSPSSVIYGQYRSLVFGDEEKDFVFGGVASDYFYVINVERARYKEKLLPGSFNLQLVNGAQTINLTDNSKDISTISYVDAGRVFEIVSGSNGSATTGSGYTTSNGSYGKFLPDVGVIILNGKALDDATDGITLSTSLADNTNGQNNKKLFDAIDANTIIRMQSEETVTSNYVFIRVRNGEFNYTTNPSNLTSSGELRYDVMVNSPQGYITSVGLYNDNNDLIAIAKLSRPLLKDFTKEALVRIKLDY